VSDGVNIVADPLVLISGWDGAEVSFVPGDFSNATFYPVKRTAPSLMKHFKANPGEAVRVRASLAKDLFGLTDRELWL
jgi:hypothetical protein